jgi:hypothetical protein
MNIKSAKISDGLYLAHVNAPLDANVKVLPPSVNRIFICDVSGSMSGDLPSLRQHLKTNLGNVVSKDDTVTIIWFSSRGQFGVVVEGARIHNKTDLEDMHEAIDRRLRPVGLTGFKEPLEEVSRVVSRLRTKDENAAFSMVFMSDGHDNQWSKKEILEATSALATSMASATIVEYGWYANRPLLIAMAEEIGGEYAFAEDAGHFTPLLDDNLRRRVGGMSRRLLTLPASPLHGIAFSVNGNSLSTFTVGADMQSIRVSADLTEFFFLSETPVGHVVVINDARTADTDLVKGLYASLALLSQRMMSSEVFQVLKILGDVALIARFSSCFGKQQYSAFREAVLLSASDATQRWVGGYDVNAVPADDAYTVLDLLSDLTGEDGNMLRLDDESWNYSKVGRKTVLASEKIDDNQKAEIEGMLAGAKTASDLAVIRERMEEMEATQDKTYRFKGDKAKGVPLTTLVYNEDRPNVSVQTRQSGQLLLGADGPAHGLPEEVPTVIFRNYTIIRDGILNVQILPVTIGKATHERLVANGVLKGAWVEGAVEKIAFTALPIINRRMVKHFSAHECFNLEFDMLKTKAAQKVFKYYEDQNAPRDRSAGLTERYGAEATAWLKEIGLTDGGFAPKVVQAEATDVYIGRELKIAIKGLSSLPKVTDVEERMDDKKGKALTNAMALMAPYVREVREFLASAIYNNASDKPALLKTWLQDKTKFWIKVSRRLNRRLSEIKFSIVVGQVWFSEFESLDEGSLNIVTDIGELSVNATIRDIEVKI